MPRLGVEARDVPLYDAGGFKLAEFRTLFGGASLEAGRQFGDWGELRVGVERGIGTAELNEGSAPFDEVDIEIGRVFVQAGVDTLDQPYFARKGTRAGARWVQALEALGSERDYQTLSIDLAHAMSWGDHRLVLTAAGGSVLDGELSLDALYRLGGPFSLSGLQRDELTGEAFARAGMFYLVKVNDAEPRFFGVPLYTGGSLEAGNAWADREAAALDNVILGGSLFVGADTFLGPAFVGYGHAEGDRHSVFLFLGRPF
jgi:NTE family protein